LIAFTEESVLDSFIFMT